MIYSIVAAILSIGVAAFVFIRKKSSSLDYSEVKSTFEHVQPIKTEEFDRYIILKGSSKEYVLHSIQECFNIYTSPKKSPQSFDVGEVDGLIFVKIPQNITYRVYHSLIKWCTKQEFSQSLPTEVIGAAFNKSQPKLSYYCYLDPYTPEDDTLIGIFDDDSLFYIYLITAGEEEEGNITVTDGVKMTVQEIRNAISKHNISYEEIESVEYESMSFDVGSMT